MASMTTYDRSNGGSQISPLLGSFDDLLRGFFVRPMNWQGESGFRTPLKVEVSESENAYRVIAEIPGVRKEDINISIDGPQIELSAEIKRENEANEQQGGSRVLHSERYYGKVTRALTLGCEIDEANAQARYENGVLEVTLPKSPDATPKRITIQ